MKQSVTRTWGTIGMLALLLRLTPAGLADAGLKISDAHGKQRDIDAVITQISTARVVFIGENHDRYDQHLSELEIIRRLYERAPKRWAVGVEFIQRPFQSYVDRYIQGTITEREFLRKTEYFDRWGFDYRLYRPIFEFAKEHGIPIVALNAEKELTEKVGKAGLEGLDPSERGRLPAQIDKSDRTYRKRIHKVFKEHPESTGGNFEHFWEAQLVWDETMADQTVEYLVAHPDGSMVVLAGAGHIEFGSGIPNRVKRRLPGAQTYVLITTGKARPRDGLADFFLVSERRNLPPAPKMGIVMEEDHGVRVKEVTPGGSAAQSGIQPKDRIVAIDGQPVTSVGDVRLALLDKKAGDRVAVRIRREGNAGSEEHQVDLELR